ncbi:MAG: O-antigen ligase like membrane protein [Phormidesmis priestleyi Ana]|uniref:O-antigen ligase like membrane protein n=1 Tax=Phormidesmis priestleyi Ana TaxID=1666911 RepID=A0A0P7YZZ0_9CYAN|nr:MAG: O-antigen ligase like membrane protein [Phormidesmis priestleyi Ana]
MRYPPSLNAHSPKQLRPAIAWIAIITFILLTLLCVVARLGMVLNLLFPAGALVVAALLYVRYPLMYVSFTWWLWFLAAWVRRLADFYGAGWTDPSPILLAPLLATMISAITFLRCIRHPTVGLPFLLCIASVAYGFLVGMLLNSPQTVLLSFVGWSAPVFFGFHLFTHWQHYPHYRQTLQRTFLWGVVVMGGYGIVQYLFAPPWDQFWLAQALIHDGFNSAGVPEPLGIRVFSTLNAPQPFAGIMMAGVLLMLTTTSKLQPLAATLGAIAILLSLARSAWIGLIVGLLVLIPSLKSSLQIRLIGGLLALLLLIVPIVQIEPFASTILPRVQGLSNTQDVSIQDRTTGYQQLLGEAFSDITGRGLGFSLENNSIGSRDSGILSLWFSLGWLGSLPYLTGICLLLLSLFQTPVSRFDLFASAARAIAVGTFLQIGLNIITAGQLAMVLWAFLGIGMAARQYHTYHQRLQQNSPQQNTLPGLLSASAYHQN